MLLLLLNSRLLDWIFRRGAAEHANGYYAANRQFIANLPIRVPSGADADRCDRLGRRLHELAAAAASERRDFLSWLAATLGAAPGTVASVRDLARYEALAGTEVVRLLARRRARLDVDPRERATRELIEREHRSSAERVLASTSALAAAEAEADDLVYELYGIGAAMRAQVDAEYAS